MFLRYLEPIFKPFRAVRTKWVQGKNVKGNIKVEANRVKSFGNMAKGKVGAAQGAVQKGNGKIQPVKAGGQAPGVPAPGAPPAVQPNPGVKKVGLFSKKKVCMQCNAELDKSWDSCPYCAQAAAAAAAAQRQPQKTQAFMVDVSGSGRTMQLLGWIVPVKGAERGELFTLSPVSTIGTDPSSTVVLTDQFMSSRHAEIKAEGGVWVIKDLGSTNGTFVNETRIDKQELVDNDMIKFGQCVVKFKSL